MRRAALALLAAACISDSDIALALEGYCAAANGRATCGPSASACCPGFACVAETCKRPTVGTCVAPDAGLGAGAACGCNADCSGDSCVDSTCR